MPWTEVSIMDAREEFCQLALKEGPTVRELCRRFGISPTTGYLWLRRYQQEGREGLINRSKRPQTSPRRTSREVEEAVIALRKQHPAWGGRKLRCVLLREGMPSPSRSTITTILQRHGLLSPAEVTHRPWSRFEAAFPNALWQMDYKGHFPLVRGGRCHPFTVLDDHARFALGIRALSNERTHSVKGELISIFQRYGLPNRILCDNGPPWGSSSPGAFTQLAVWLLHLDIIPSHGRPFHPQTQGKDERFHRTLQAEVLATRSFQTLDHVQETLDQWRHTYNHVRPHEAIGLVPPIARYTPSPRPYPEQLPAIEYPETDVVRRVTSRGVINLWGRHYYLGEGFYGYPVAVRPSAEEGIHTVFFRHYAITNIDQSASLTL